MIILGVVYESFKHLQKISNSFQLPEIIAPSSQVLSTTADTSGSTYSITSGSTKTLTYGLSSGNGYYQYNNCRALISLVVFKIYYG